MKRPMKIAGIARSIARSEAYCTAKSELLYNKKRLITNKNTEATIAFLLIPFSNVLKTSKAPDVYSGYEKIPFEKRNPIYKSIMRQEFASEVRSD